MRAIFSRAMSRICRRSSSRVKRPPERTTTSRPATAAHNSNSARHLTAHRLRGPGPRRSRERRARGRGGMEQRWGLPLIAWPSRLRPNLWDLVALPLVLGALALVAWGGMAMGARYEIGDALPISLDPWRLPEYALRTVLRMVAALVASLVFSLAYARARGQEPAGREDPDPGARHPAIGADPRLSVDHRHRLHRAVSRAGCSASNAPRSSRSSPRRPGT